MTQTHVTLPDRPGSLCHTVVRSGSEALNYPELMFTHLIVHVPSVVLNHTEIWNLNNMFAWVFPWRTCNACSCCKNPTNFAKNMHDVQTKLLSTISACWCLSSWLMFTLWQARRKQNWIGPAEYVATRGGLRGKFSKFDVLRSLVRPFLDPYL